MTKPATPADPVDVIDRFADDLARHPDRADDLKRELRARIGLAPRSVPAAVPGPAPAAADPEDLWDNVPV